MKNELTTLPDIYELGKEVLHYIRGRNGHESYVFDDGTASASEAQQAIIDQMIENGTWNETTFSNAMLTANRDFADDLVEGKLPINTLASPEGRLVELLDEVRKMDNPELLESAKDLVHAALSDEVLGVSVRFCDGWNRVFDKDGRDPKLGIMSVANRNSEWMLSNLSNAMGNALAGDFDAHNYKGINQFIKDHTKRLDMHTGSQNYHKVLQLAAKAFKGDMKDHLEANPEVKSELAISQAAAAKPDAFRPS